LNEKKFVTGYFLYTIYFHCETLKNTYVYRLGLRSRYAYPNVSNFKLKCHDLLPYELRFLINKWRIFRLSYFDFLLATMNSINCHFRIIHKLSFLAFPIFTFTQLFFFLIWFFILLNLFILLIFEFDSFFTLDSSKMISRYCYLSLFLSSCNHFVRSQW